MVALREQGTDLVAIWNVYLPSSHSFGGTAADKSPFRRYQQDIGSYPMEKSRGLELHNAVELVMHEQGLDIQGAIDWLERYLAGVHAGFLDNVAHMPSWGEDVDRRVNIYVNGIAQWVRGSDDWTFESGRYYGNEGLEVKKTRIMSLLPPSEGFVKRSA